MGVIPPYEVTAGRQELLRYWCFRNTDVSNGAWFEIPTKKHRGHGKMTFGRSVPMIPLYWSFSFDNAQ